jgi:hypothetical protein
MKNNDIKVTEILLNAKLAAYSFIALTMHLSIYAVLIEIFRSFDYTPPRNPSALFAMAGGIVIFVSVLILIRAHQIIRDFVSFGIAFVISRKADSSKPSLLESLNYIWENKGKIVNFIFSSEKTGLVKYELFKGRLTLNGRVYHRTKARNLPPFFILMNYFSVAERSFDKTHCAKKAISFIEQTEETYFLGIDKFKYSLFIWGFPLAIVIWMIIISSPNTESSIPILRVIVALFPLFLMVFGLIILSIYPIVLANKFREAD